MPSRATLDWHGDELVKKVTEAARGAIDEVTDEAVEDAQRSHAWLARRGRRGLEGEIVSAAAHVEGARVTGRFGTTRRRGFHGLFHEEGTVHEHERPFLRPAADRHFPTLAARIRRRLG